MNPATSSNSNKASDKPTSGNATVDKSSELSRPSASLLDREIEDSHSIHSEDEEDMEDYKRGGYHYIAVGDVFSDGRYVTLRKLGWGHFSTVWLARDTVMSRYVALKVVKSASHYTETAVDEIKLLERIVQANPDAPGRKYVVELLDHFVHQGPNGLHVCMVFEVLGENLLSVIRRYRHRGIPIHLVRQIIYQVLMGLDYMHRECGIIHTDLKPENVLVCVDDVDEVVKGLIGDLDYSDPKALAQSSRSSKAKVVGSKPLTQTDLADSGSQGKAEQLENDSSAEGNNENTEEISSSSTSNNALSKNQKKKRRQKQIKQEARSGTTEEYVEGSNDENPMTAANLERTMSDITLDAQAEASTATKSSSNQRRSKETPLPPKTITVKIADLGNACWEDHHFTNDIQTRQYRSPEVILGSKWGPSTDIWSVACMTFELVTGDYLFDPQSGPSYNKNDGYYPKRLALNGKYSQELFNRKGDLRHIHKLRIWPLHDVVNEKYMMPRPEADFLANFLNRMLILDPLQRASAEEMVQHPWLFVKDELGSDAGEIEGGDREAMDEDTDGERAEPEGGASTKVTKNNVDTMGKKGGASSSSRRARGSNEEAMSDDGGMDEGEN
ncbi:serine/threonine protein kinase, CMGC group [Lunasporangiospora selenospora]|uniref:non-specific serine/threonine protein kinase n=1 Tax=Lunasporangiospora selenospora TaxID=979761 RepID=A0A9P6KFP9_9FUNG|nr:serine/threonine protein kinase, CMGC group [Lunasporangiospora selenospora]